MLKNLEIVASHVMSSRMLFPRSGYAALLRTHLQTFPAGAVLGPRQCGKSTLVREFVKTLPRRSQVEYGLSVLAGVARLQRQSLWSLNCAPSFFVAGAL
jgi:predicted AAA+ superfamily ATPase